MDWSNTSKPRWFGAVFVVILMTAVAIYVTYRNGYPWISGSIGVPFVAQVGYLYYCDRSNTGRNRIIEIAIGVAIFVFVGYVFYVIERARVHILAGLIFLAYFFIDDIGKTYSGDLFPTWGSSGEGHYGHPHLGYGGFRTRQRPGPGRMKGRGLRGGEAATL
jgi:hypothetical protein